MKKTLLMLGAMALMSSTMFGAACLSSTTAAALVALGAGGCDVVMNGDTITFSNFGATGSFSGTTATLDLSIGVGQVGFQFSIPGASLPATTGVLSYTATIKSGSCLTGACSINGVFEQAAFTPQSSTGTVTFVESAGSPATLTASSQTDGLAGTINVQQLVKTSMTYNGGATLTNFQSDIYTSTVPEPMTLSMMGIGLLGLGLMRRRQMGKK